MDISTKPRVNPASPERREPGAILCVGTTPCLQRTLFFDGFRPGEVNRASKVLETASGKATNVARIVNQLGGRSRLISFAGGTRGSRMRDLLDEDRVDADWIMTECQTRVCQTIIDAKANQATELVEEAVNPSKEEWDRFWTLCDSRLPTARMMVIAGSPPPGAAADCYRKLIERAARFGVPVLVDCQKEPLLQAAKANPWMLKMNREELARTARMPVDTDQDLMAAAQALLIKPDQSCVVSNGKDPAWLVRKQHCAAFDIPKVDAVNPIGSGDAMSAGIAFAVASGRTLEQSVEWGVACGSVNATTLTSGVIDIDEVIRLMAAK